MAKNEGPTYQKRTKRVVLPPVGWPIREFVMRELDGLDDLEIAGWVDRKTSTVTDSFEARMTLERKEAMRCALVSVDGEPVNSDGVPYAAMDRWPHRLMVIVGNAFNELNAVENAEIKKILAGAYDDEESAESEALPIVGRSAG